MQVQINTDTNVDGHEAAAAHFRGLVEHALGRFRGRVTRVEVHLADENGAKIGQNDKRCTIVARLENHRPTVVTHHAETLDAAVHGAAASMVRSLGSTLDRDQNHRV